MVPGVRGAVGGELARTSFSLGAARLTGTSTVDDAVGDADDPMASICARRHVNSRFALMPDSSAIDETPAFGSRLRATGSRLNSGLCSRRWRWALMTWLLMMCIKGLMHTVVVARTISDRAEWAEQLQEGLQATLTGGHLGRSQVRASTKGFSFAGSR